MMTVRNDRGSSRLIIVIVVGSLLLIGTFTALYVGKKRAEDCDRAAGRDLARLGAAFERLMNEAIDLNCSDFVPKGRYIQFMVGPYYGWGGTNRKCDVRVRGVGDEAWACAMGGARQGGDENSRYIHRVSLRGGADLPTTRGECRGNTYGGPNSACYISSIIGIDCRARVDPTGHVPDPKRAKACRAAIAKIKGTAGDLRSLAENQLSPFSVDLYHGLINEGKNLFFSPIGAYSTLAMAYGGAAGETREIMAKAMRLGNPNMDVHRLVVSLHEWATCSAHLSDGQLDLQNRIWGQEGQSFTQEYRDLLNTYYGNRASDSVSLDASRNDAFSSLHGDPEARRGSGDRKAPAVSMNRDGRLLLVNKIFFKCAWQGPFEENLTQERPFYLLDGKEVKRPTMNARDRLKYMGNRLLEAVEIPYKGGVLSMLIFLPRDKDGLPDLEAKLTANALEGWINEMEVWPYGVILYIPKFEWDFKVDLKRAYKKLGLAQIFCNPAQETGCGEAPDFSRMTGTRGDPWQDLFFSGAEQLGFVEVSEEGTVAYVESVMCGNVTGSMGGPEPPEPKPVIFRADHPFLYLVRHNPTGCIVFMGRLTEP